MKVAERFLKKRRMYSLPHRCLLLLLLAYGCTPSNGLMIINHTPGDIVVIDGARNGRVISKREMTIQSSAKGFVPTPVYARFEGDRLGLLEIKIREPAGAVRTASCVIEQRNRGGCLYKAGYNGSEKLTCVCDPYGDFS